MSRNSETDSYTLIYCSGILLIRVRVYLATFGPLVQISRKICHTSFFTLLIMPRQRQKKMTEAEKAQVIQSYDQDMAPSVIAAVLNKSTSSIRTFMCRHRYIQEVGVPVRQERRKTTGRCGQLLKILVLEFPKLSLPKLRTKLTSCFSPYRLLVLYS